LRTLAIAFGFGAAFVFPLDFGVALGFGRGAIDT